MFPPHDLRGDAAATRKLANLLSGDYLLYELTAKREMRVLHLPRRLSPPVAAAGRASRRAGGGATPAP
jgi:hypothetical protein